MKRRLTRSFASMGAATLLISGAATVLASHAGADTTPPWEVTGAKDANEVGTLALYDAAGNQVTSGSVTDAPLAAFMVGSTADSAHTKATAYFYTPKTGVAPGAWGGEQITASTSYPVSAGTGVPTVVSNATGPVVTGSASDETIATYMGDFPNTDDATPGYVNAFQLRVKTSTDGTYQSLDFVVSGITKDGDGNVTGGTWTETYPGATPVVTKIHNVKKPTLSGKHKVGKKETVHPGKWSPKPTKFTYQWLRDGKKIKGAKKSTYTPTKKDKGKKLSCKVTAKRSGYKSASAKTKAVKVKK